MAHVIIPPEHQSAPKGIVLTEKQIREAQEFHESRRKRKAAGSSTWEAFDAEMEAEVTNPVIEAEVRELERRDRAQSSSAMIEEALRQHEENEMMSGNQRWAGQDRWQGRENEQMRLVRIMHPYTFLRHLRRAGIDARPDESPYARIWLNSWSRVGRIGVNAWVLKHGRMRAETITTLQYPYSPEYSVMRFNSYNVPTNERYRGWRTTLLALITASVITEAEADRAFGPALGPAGEFYRAQLYHHRRITLGLDRY